MKINLCISLVCSSFNYENARSRKQNNNNNNNNNNNIVVFDYFIHSLYTVINTQRGWHTLILRSSYFSTHEKVRRIYTDHAGSARCCVDYFRLESNCIKLPNNSYFCQTLLYKIKTLTKICR